MRRAIRYVSLALTLLAGGFIAWMDTRPRWDDTGITAVALMVVAGLAALAGVKWWLATALAVGPLLLAESLHVGWGILLAPAITLVGAGGGVLLRQIVSPT